MRFQKVIFKCSVNRPLLVMLYSGKINIKTVLSLILEDF